VSTRIRRSTSTSALDAEVGAAGGEVSADLSAAVTRAAGHGERLGGRIQARMENALGVDLSAVRVHRESELAPRMGAIAFTSGADIHFAPGGYAPHHAEGQEVLAHELAHVVQQGAAPTRIRRMSSSGTDSEAPALTGRSGSDELRIRRGSAAKIQRLVGFEVELSVPTIGNVPGPALNPNVGGAVPNPNIATFFGGGLGYNTAIGQVASFAGPIAMKADHNRLQRDAGALYNALMALPSNVPFAPLVPAGGYVAMSNLEYSTPALDEMAAGSNLMFLLLATAIDAHAQQLLNNQPANQLSWIPNSAPQTATGVPVAELTAWLGAPLPGPVAAALTTLRNNVRWSMYVQATAGVLPSGLATLFTARAAAAPAGAAGSWTAAKQDAGNAIVNGINQLFLDPVFQAQIAAAGQGDQEALKGLLMLGLAYTIGNAINQTTLLTSTMKNAVPLLVKIADIGAATTLASTNWLRANPVTPAFVLNVATWFHNHVPQTNLAHWTGAPYNAAMAVPVGDRGLLHGTGAVPVNDTAGLLNRLLTGGGPMFPTVAPGVNALVAADPVSPLLGPSGGQAGLPVEYRWNLPRPVAIGQLWPVMQLVLAEVRAANLAHVGAAAAGPIAAAW
jgi:hypothetical protein